MAEVEKDGSSSEVSTESKSERLGNSQQRSPTALKMLVQAGTQAWPMIDLRSVTYLLPDFL
jgi:hypothetical protein